MTRYEKIRKVKAYLRLCRMRGNRSFRTSDLIRYATGSFLDGRSSENALFINREWEHFMASLSTIAGSIKRDGNVFCKDDRKKAVKTTLWQIV